jgi:branched-chain amino acid transport system substrate-binding protein
MKTSTLVSLAFIFCFFTSIFSSPPPQPSSTLKLAVLLPLTGDLRAQGQTQALAAQLARSELETYFQDIKAPFRINMEIRDTETNSDTALKHMQELHKKGFNVFVGPSTSESVKSCLKYAKENDLIIISPSSTSADLSSYNDNLYRMVPNDLHQGQALSTLLIKEKIKIVVIINRADDWGDGLQESFKKQFTSLGGEVYSNIRYSPKTTTFNNQLNHLAEALEKATAEHPSESVAVFLVGFNEAAQILEEANRKPYLTSFKWFGSDASANNPAISRSKKALMFANKVQFRSPKFEIPEHALGRYNIFSKKLQSIYEKPTDPYAAATYDSVKLIAHSFPWVQHQPYFKFWKKSLNYHALNSMGVTGWLLLDKSGERTVASFSFWELEKKGSSYLWVTRNSFHKTTPSEEEI